MKTYYFHFSFNPGQCKIVYEVYFGAQEIFVLYFIVYILLYTGWTIITHAHSLSALAPPPFPAPSFSSISASSLQPRVWVFVLTARDFLVWKPFLHLISEFKWTILLSTEYPERSWIELLCTILSNFLLFNLSFWRLLSVFFGLFFCDWTCFSPRRARAALCVVWCLRNRENGEVGSWPKSALLCACSGVGSAPPGSGSRVRAHAGGTATMGCGLRKLEEPEDSSPGKIYSTLRRPQVETKTDTVYEYVLLDFSLEGTSGF